jgi:hypothetical protein
LQLWPGFTLQIQLVLRFGLAAPRGDSSTRFHMLVIRRAAGLQAVHPSHLNTDKYWQRRNNGPQQQDCEQK